MDSENFAFGSFKLMPTERTLLDGGKPLRLGSRALDILITLVEQAGKTVRKDDLIARVWPDTTVDEASLRVQIAALRKTLGDGRDGNRFITNIPGRGYSFVGSAVREQAGEQAGEQAAEQAGERGVRAPVSATRGNDIPASLTRVVGRTGIIMTLAAQLERRRLVTIVGPGGMGKTTIAAAVAEAVRDTYADGVWFVGLASLPSPELLPSAVGATIGIPLSNGNPIAGLTAWLRDKHALIVLDNCEHIVGAVATLAAAMIKSAPRVSVLATSREPLRTEGEWRHRLAPLEFPADATGLALAVALRFSAVQLFHERALANADEFVLGEGDIPAIVEICRRLDGVPLALELAAAHVGVLGVKGLAARLDDRLALLIQGRRTALPRHQTLRATLDWSYGLLPEAEQIILRRLAVFQGDFTMDAASAVAADTQLTPDRVVNAVANLVDKSLIVADIGGEVTYYHLLEMTRTYALERLQQNGERAALQRVHADYYREVFAAAKAAAAVDSRDEWRAGYGRQIGNLRAALAWAFAPGGDAATGVALAAAATDFWIALSLLSECCDWASKAVAQLGAAEGTRDEMMLQFGLGQALTYTRGMHLEARSAYARALALSEAWADVGYQLRGIYGLWLFALRVVDFRECIPQCEKCERLGKSTGDALASATADLMFGVTRYYLAEHAAAAVNLQRVRDTYPVAMTGGDPIRYGASMLSNALCYQAVTFWSLGFAEKAYRAGRDAIKEARGTDYPVALCIALAAPSSIVLVKMGYLEEAERCIDELISHSQENSLIPYYAFGLCSKGGLMMARGDLAEAERFLLLGLQRSREVAYYLFDAFFQGELAAVLGSTGRIDEGLLEIDAAIDYAERSQSLWCLPELMRIKGELLCGRSGAERSAAEEWFIRSQKMAAGQEALAWELRAAMSLGRIWWDQGRAADAHALVSDVHRRFTEGFDTADLKAAENLLRRWAKA